MASSTKMRRVCQAPGIATATFQVAIGSEWDNMLGDALQSGAEVTITNEPMTFTGLVIRAGHAYLTGWATYELQEKP